MLTFLNFLTCCLCFRLIILNDAAREIEINSHSSFRFVNFVEHKFRYLEASKHAEVKVREFADCAMKCLGTSACISLNMASSPDDGETFWCELMLADMFNNSQNFKENATSHHFSQWVS